MLAKLLIIAVFLTVLFALGSALFFMMRDRGTGERAVRALTLRVGLSLALFVLLFIMFAAGYIQPHGLVR